MLNFDTQNDNICWRIDYFLRQYQTGNFKDIIDSTEYFYVASEPHLLADDMGGLGSSNEFLIQHNRELPNVSPYECMGHYSDKFVATILLSYKNDLSEIKRLCEKFPQKRFYFLVGISTFPNNDELAPLHQLADTLMSLNCDNLHICFLNGWDMYFDSIGDFNRVEKFKEELSDFPKERLQFLLSNFKLVELYKDAFTDADVQYYTIYPIRIADSTGKSTLPKSICKDNKNFNKIRRKKLICLNNYEKRHRTRIVEHIRDWENEIYFSYREKGFKLEKETMPDFRGDIVQHEFMINQDSPPYRLIKDSYCWVGCETLYHGNFGSEEGAFSSNNLLPKELCEGFVTEKTYKAFYYELPLLHVGLPHTYQWLHNLGFATFPEIFDESFDSEEDDVIRMQMITKELRDYLNTPLKEIHEKFWSNIIQEKLEHNKWLVTKLAKEDPFNHMAYREKYGN